jgi:hypothetical protein
MAIVRSEGGTFVRVNARILELLAGPRLPRHPRYIGIIAAMSVAEVVTGSFEIHVFVAPLQPDAATAGAFTRACAGHMKALLLNLDYVGQGFVGVLQSSRYVQGDVAAARAAAAHDAEILRAAGFTVIREKVEALASCAGVPQNVDDAARSPADRYFEFHVLVDRPGRPIDDADVASLRGLADEFSRRLATPVPLSYNALKPAQRFLNLRARGVGLAEALAPVRALETAIAAVPGLEVKKVIAEYICFDSNRAVDNGWLEPPDAA